MKVNKINTILSTLNFVLCFVGYSIITTMFLPVSSDIENITRSITVPYRVFTLLLALIVISINFKKRINFNNRLLCFYCFLGLYVLRILYDLYIQDIHVSSEYASKTLFSLFGMCLPMVYAVIKSYKYVDLEKALKWIFYLSCASLLFTLFGNQLMFVDTGDINSRQAGNVAMTSIAFGHLGVRSFILGLFVMNKRKLTTIMKSIVVLLLLLSLFCTFRAASRGPILSLIVILAFWLFSRSRKMLLGFIILLIFSGIIYIFTDSILYLLGDISPVLKIRMEATLIEGNTSGRDVLFKDALHLFYSSPIWGKQYVTSSGIYSHNLILDALMGLGVIGGGLLMYMLIFVLRRSYSAIKNTDNHFWIFMIAIQQIMLTMTSSAIYFNQLLLVLFAFLFSKYRNKEGFDYKKSLSNI